jgi:hypothetical protein
MRCNFTRYNNDYINVEKRKSQLHKSTKIHHDINVRIKNIENKLDDSLKFIFNNGLHNILFIIREEVNEQNIKLRDDIKPLYNLHINNL